ncbi:MAG TPA: hypothetical protein VFB32_10860 [Rudaea sp.]|nr:hypothetical protein [Rudaea sp.]
MNPRTKNRLYLLLIVAAFAIPMALAFVLRFEGWHPVKTRNSGDLVEPPRDVSAVPVTLADGSKLVWRDPAWQWTLLALPGAQCAAVCRERLDEILRMRLTLGRNAERLRVVYLGPALPADFIAARTPLLAGSDDSGAFSGDRAKDGDDLALALVDPNGALMMRYGQGYDARGLREDVVKVLH